jgi:hypothetical protein
MRNWLVVGVVVGVVGAVAGGCSSSAPSGDYTTFCQQLAQAECPPVASVCAQPTAPQCEATVSAQCESAALALIQSGKREFTSDTNVVASCLSSIQSLFGNVSPGGSTFVTWANLNGSSSTDAPGSGSPNDLCNLVFAGTVPADQDCVTSYDCESPNVCGSNGSCGPAGDPKQAGEGCADPGDVCAPGTVCSLQGSHFLCGSGQPVGASCSTNSPCATSAECVKGKCKALAGEGGECTSNADCDPTVPNSGFCDTSLSKPICTAGYSFATESPDCSGFKGTALYTGN